MSSVRTRPGQHIAHLVTTTFEAAKEQTHADGPADVGLEPNDTAVVARASADKASTPPTTQAALTLPGTSASRPSRGPVALRLPPRDPRATPGSAFIASIVKLTGAKRDAAILNEVLRGNVPEFLRHPVKVPLRWTGPSGKQHTGSIRVMPDYLAVGSNDDFVRVPMSPQTAQKIAERFGATLPTAHLVDVIYAAATVKLSPHTVWDALPRMSRDEKFAFMHNTRSILWHNEATEAERKGEQLGALTAGHQKDVVLTNRLLNRPGHVAIYGWHGKNGRPIQPLSTIHKQSYVDYSHGVRLISKTMTVDGRSVSIEQVERDAELAPAIAGTEHTLRFTRYP